ncbi:hypothetical protein [Natronoglycomyces albus]|uniref:Uncharacterized protein n=1 Tax=Natronoglycomyces albus TaxID=2811108 RepID=A0A895XQB7_9ACTN|nr:hypothetical protein [Natronoglycomyces albus]QSB05902.1 hypothetical protein JQS30_02965 [Natronoglycomyces albus]
MSTPESDPNDIGEAAPEVGGEDQAASKPTTSAQATSHLRTPVAPQAFASPWRDTVSPPLRTRTAGLLLLISTVLVAVALSQWLVGTGTDPRDSLGSRAAGIGFTDTARQTLFSALPLALPLLAVWVSPRVTIRQFAIILYAITLAVGCFLAAAAAAYGWDLANQQESLGAVWVTQRDVVERAVHDVAWLTAVVLALVWTRKARPHRASDSPSTATS